MPAAAIFGGAVLGAYSADRSASAQRNASRDAANASSAASAASLEEQRRQYDQARADSASYRNVGEQAMNALGGLYGFAPLSGYVPDRIPSYEEWRTQNGYSRPTFTPGNGLAGGVVSALQHRDSFAADDAARRAEYQNYVSSITDRNRQAGGASIPARGPGSNSSFFASPDYQFRRDEGMRDIQGQFAARGGARSGNALRALAGYNSNLASGEYGNYVNRLFGLANIGASGSSGLATLGANTANSMANVNMGNAANQGNAFMNAGNARASGYQGVANAFNQGLGNYLMYSQMGPAAQAAGWAARPMVG